MTDFVLAPFCRFAGRMTRELVSGLTPSGPYQSDPVQLPSKLQGAALSVCLVEFDQTIRLEKSRSFQVATSDDDDKVVRVAEHSHSVSNVRESGR